MENGDIQDNAPELTTPDPGKGDGDKLVPEKDLQAVKAGREKAETALKEAQAEIQTLKEHQTKGDADSSGKLEAALKEAQAAKEALTSAEEKHKTTESELQLMKGAELQTMKDAIIKAGIPEEKIASLDKDGLEKVMLGLSAKSKPDLGTGTGTGSPLGAREKIRAGLDAIHPGGK